MKLINCIPVLLFVIGAVSVQLPTPEVDRVAADFGRNVEAAVVSKRQSTPYWYETITHQGISAFGPSGYEVFRNVKDYGAKGKPQLEQFSLTDFLTSRLLQVMASPMTRLQLMLLSMQEDAVVRGVLLPQPLQQLFISRLEPTSSPPPSLISTTPNSLEIPMTSRL
jgi:hypothetical protein